MSRIATDDSAIATFVQSAPRLLSLLHQMRPTWRLPSLLALDPAFVERHAIKGIVRDALGDAVLFRRLFEGADSWTPDELAARLAEGARVIRKPNRLLVEYAVRELEATRDSVLMVGDQYLTDVAGANLAGVRSVKLPTVEPGSFRWSVRISQRIESLLFALLY